MKIDNPPGATPLDDEALQGLIPSLTIQGELNEFEVRNIVEAICLQNGKANIQVKLNLFCSNACICRLARIFRYGRAFRAFRGRSRR